MEEISRIFENKSGEISPNFLLKGGVINYNSAVVFFKCTYGTEISCQRLHDIVLLTRSGNLGSEKIHNLVRTISRLCKVR